MDNSRSTNPLSQFGMGIRFYLAGLRMLFKHPSLMGLSLVPIVVTFSLLLLFAFGLALSIRAALSESIGDDVRNSASVVIFILALLLGYLFYLPLARVILAPFSETLSRKAHSLNNGGHKIQSSIGWGRAMIEGLKMATLHILVGLIALALSIAFPPIGVPLGIVIAVFLCGLDFLDVPLSSRGFPLRKKLSLILANRSLALGFGVAAYFSLLIPLVNLLLLPVGVIGATLLADHLDINKN